MKATKNVLSLLYTIIVVLFMAGCSTARYVSPDAPSWAVGIVKTSDPLKIRISSVDGKPATGTFQGHPVNELPDTIKVFPGYHEIIPCYNDRNGLVIGEKLSFFSQGAQNYTIYYKIKWDKSIRFWVDNNGIDITTEN